MPAQTDTVTLALQGEVGLAEFAEAVTRFSGLVTALSAERTTGGIRWEINDLAVSSAMATARGIVEESGTAEDVEWVVDAYLTVGRALAEQRPVPFASQVSDQARGLAQVIGNGIEAVRFETAEADALVAAPLPAQSGPRELVGAYGAVRGRVQTLTSRSSLRFNLYDTIHDRAVSCYLAQGMESRARDIWDKQASVSGWVTRDPESGRPLSVRRVDAIEIIGEGDWLGYERARGARPRSTETARAEERIRQLRDAG